MRWTLLIFLLALFLSGCIVIETEVISPQAKESETGDVNMKLTSNAFKHGEMIPGKYTCQGDDINPQLKWDDAPAGTKSFALIVDDPDAPMGTWVHWLVKDIPADTKDIPENSVPGTQVANDFSREEYGGPCPPSGTHRYFFRLYALDVDTFEADNKADFYRQVEEHKIEEAVLMGKYSR